MRSTCSRWRAVDDQDPVEALAAESANPTLGVRIRVRSSDRRPDDPHALAVEDLVEGAAELTVAVVKQKAEGAGYENSVLRDEMRNLQARPNLRTHEVRR
jgi:hypothetical protein